MLPRYQPMLPVDEELADGSGWVHEIKWDGYRVLAYCADGHVKLASRRGNSLNKRFPAVTQALTIFPDRAVLDGEVVAFDRQGKPSFSLLQKSRDSVLSLRFVVFDLLYLRDRSLCSLPWYERRALLEEECTGLPLVLVSPLLFKDVESSLSFVKEHGLEGIVSKAEDSPYLPGQRSRFWRKRKLIRTMDLVVMGVNAVGSRIRSFGAGVYDTKGRLLFLGNVGSGLNQNDLDFLADAVPLLALEPPQVGDSSFIRFRPHLVAEVECLELIEQLRLRHPVFKRFRFDKRTEECRLEDDGP